METADVQVHAEQMEQVAPIHLTASQKYVRLMVPVQHLHAVTGYSMMENQMWTADQSVVPRNALMDSNVLTILIVRVENVSLVTVEETVSQTVPLDSSAVAPVIAQAVSVSREYVDSHHALMGS